MAYTPYLVLLAGILYIVYRRYTRLSIAHIRGPPSRGFWLGNLRDLAEGGVGVTDIEWQRQFGTVVRIKGPLNEDRLWISDPKALQHILQTSGYDYPKLSEARAFSSLTSGDGILNVDGEVHRRHKRVLSPAFGIPEAKRCVPLLLEAAEKMVSKMNEIIASDPTGKSATIDMPFWLSRATLDAIGAAAFDYDFGALDSLDNKLTKSYTNLLLSIFGAPSSFDIFIRDAAQYVPGRLLRALFGNMPGAAFVRMRENRDLVHQAARELIQSKSADLLKGEESKDIMSILAKANASEDSACRLDDNEVLDQMRTIMIAGHETTSNTISCALLSLAEHPEVQDRFRAEIRVMEAKVRVRGAREFTANDLESMPYIVAVVKESLRFDPAAFHIMREAGKDDVVPLLKPITACNGDRIHEILVPKGTKCVLSIPAYNKNPEIWGDDAGEFNPDRWLGSIERKGPTVGVYGNLSSFSAGVRACIGWRLAVVEIQTFLVTLVSHFTFSLDERTKIKRQKSGVMVPVVIGEEGCQLPLKVSLAAQS